MYALIVEKLDVFSKSLFNKMKRHDQYSRDFNSQNANRSENNPNGYEPIALNKIRRVALALSGNRAQLIMELAALTTIVLTMSTIAGVVMIGGLFLFRNEFHQLTAAVAQTLTLGIASIPMYAKDAFDFVKRKVMSCCGKKPDRSEEEEFVPGQQPSTTHRQPTVTAAATPTFYRGDSYSGPISRPGQKSHTNFGDVPPPSQPAFRGSH